MFWIVLALAAITLASSDYSFAELEFTTAQVQWIKESHSSGGYSAIQVIEPDMNQNPEKIETIKIHIWSDSDKDGITPNLHETGKNSGVFMANIYFSSNHSTGQRVHTLEDDLVIALYEDNTVSSQEKLDIMDSIIIRKTLANPDENQSFFRIDDPSFTRQNLQTGETLGDVSNLFGWFVLAMSLFIVFAYVVMKIKKRSKK